MFTKIAIIICAVLAASAMAVDPPDIQWEKTFGGVGVEVCEWAELTSDSGFIMAGYSNDMGANWIDFYMLRADKDGNLMWDTVYGTADYEYARCVQQTEDGGFVFIGYSNLYDTGGFDIYVAKMSAGGNVEWEDEYDDDNSEIDEMSNNGTGLCIAPNGDYVIASSACCIDGHPKFQGVRIRPDGGVEWNIINDFTSEENHLIVTRDSGFACIGSTGGALRVFEMSPEGAILQNMGYGSGGMGRALIELDEGYMAFGSRNFGGIYDQDFWMLRIDENLDTVWTWRSMIEGDDNCWSAAQTFDGGFIMVGEYYPPGEDLQIKAIRVDSLGNILWTKDMGGESGEYAVRVLQTPDSGYAVIGRTMSYGAGNYDIYLVKLAPDPVYLDAADDDGGPALPQFSLAQNYPNPFNPFTSIAFELPQRSAVRIRVYNLMGQEVTTLVDRILSPGRHVIGWDGRAADGSQAASGVYFYRIDAENYSASRKMILLK